MACVTVARSLFSSRVTAVLPAEDYKRCFWPRPHLLLQQEGPGQKPPQAAELVLGPNVNNKDSQDSEDLFISRFIPRLSRKSSRRLSKTSVSWHSGHYPDSMDSKDTVKNSHGYIALSFANLQYFIQLSEISNLPP